MSIRTVGGHQLDFKAFAFSKSHGLVAVRTIGPRCYILVVLIKHNGAVKVGNHLKREVVKSSLHELE